jgi:hypothetical protein
MLPNIATEHKDNCWIGDATVRQRMAEYECFCEALRDRIADDGLPPDEAYWWTRIALEEAARCCNTNLSTSQAGSAA